MKHDIAILLASMLFTSRLLAQPLDPDVSNTNDNSANVKDWPNIHCLESDTGRDHRWRGACSDLISDFNDDSTIPPNIVFGPGDITSPYTYRGPPDRPNARCEARIELITGATGRISKADVWQAAYLVDATCIARKPQGEAYWARGGWQGPIGMDRNFRLVVGKKPLPASVGEEVKVDVA